MSNLVTLTRDGLYCGEGGFYIDPWRPVPEAVISHAHSDHAVWGCGRYIAATPGEAVMRARLGDDILLTALNYNEAVEVRGVRVSLHPAGHVLGSSQIRIERRGEVCVISGDYKTVWDPTCQSFEPVRCHRFITESTFGLPIFRWHDTQDIMSEMNAWWRKNRDEGQASIVYAYALGKAQRILAQLDATIGPIVVHGAVERINAAYRQAGVSLPATMTIDEFPARHNFAGVMIVAPPSAQNTPWVRRFEPISQAVASGWMAIRGIRRRRSVDRGFVLSDHADWQGLNEAVLATGAEHVSVTHGYTDSFARWLGGRGILADTLATRFSGEAEELAPTPEVVDHLSSASDVESPAADAEATS